MKLCFPALSDHDARSLLCDHFGSAPYYVLYDQKSGEYESIPNEKSEYEHGQCRPMDLLDEYGITAVVCKSMGRNAAASIERNEIKVYMTKGETVGHAVAEFIEGNLVKFDPAKGCRGHGSRGA